MNRRVVITGTGLISPVGLDVASSWEALLAGQSGAGPITQFDATDFKVRFAAEVKGFEPEQYIDRKEAKRTDRFAQLAIGASVQAMRQAGLDESLGGIDPTRFGVIIGSGIGGIWTFEEQHRKLIERGPSRISPFFVPMFISDIAAGLVSIRWGLKGPNYCTVSACASSAHAVGNAFRSIKYGEADLMIAGGTEATVSPQTIAGFAAMTALSERNDSPETASRPFDATRDGFVLGEGSPAEGGEGAVRAIQLALKEAVATPADVDYVNAHGTSTPANDKNETAAIRTALGERAYQIVVGSTKSMTGHTLGAAGGVEAVICGMVCREGKIPPTINFHERDPDCDLDYATNGMVERPVRLALSNSFGFGGHNVCLAVRRYEA